ncbi:expressed unknown protein [Seminavis robusta]|uniref:Uncharacterized protein n=1 Tax=Seminavis robusta TaxID=568900 RepID=A0A9N8HCJ8_9STRA|nr:expressed unknown protein [Seminavis robusta]|eukprot:Sro322_g116900.1 n/a (425) ;mRNA; f:3417-4691
MISDSLCVFSLDADTDLRQVEENLLESAYACQEVRVSIVEQIFFQGSRTRTDQMVSFLQTLFRVEPRIEKLTFDSGLTSFSNVLPVEVLAVALMEGKALQRIDLSYVKIQFRNDNLQWLQDNEAKSQLRQCCLDRASLLIKDHDDNPRHPPEEMTLDPLISMLLQTCPRLAWLTICCSDASGTLTEPTLESLAMAPSLRELMLRNFDLSCQNTVSFLAALQNHSQLGRLTFPTRLTLSVAWAVARYLGSPIALQDLTLTVNQFADDDDDDDDDSTMEETTTQQHILHVIANALLVNPTLQSFRLRGSAKIPANSQQIFAAMLRRNYTLQYLTIQNDTATTNCTDNIMKSRDAAYNIQLYLKLNRYGRQSLLAHEQVSRESWVDAIVEFATDLNCLFYLLQTNPSLCSDGEGRCRLPKGGIPSHK